MQFETDKRAVFDLLNAIKSKARFEKAAIHWDSGITDLNAYYDQQANAAWAESFAPIVKGVVSDAAGHWTTETGVAAGTAFNVHHLEAEDWFNTAALKFATPINQTSKDEIAGLLQQGEMEGWTISKMQSTMTDLFTQWTNGTGDAATFAGERLPPYRTEMIARTVSMQSYNAGSTELYKQAGVEQQEWVATNDNRTRESHAAANGQVVDVDTPFDVGGAQLLFPGDDSLGADAGEIVNCRCTTVPIIPEGGLNTGDEEANAAAEDIQAVASLDWGASAWNNPEFDAWQADWKKTLGKELTTDETYAVNNYTTSRYRDINDYLRNGGTRGQDKDTMKYLVENIDSALNRELLDENLIAYRGASEKIFGIGTFPDSDLPLLVGTTITDAGYASASVTQASAFTKAYTLIYDIPAGTPGAYIAPISDAPHENEFLLGRGLSWRITDTEVTPSPSGFTRKVFLELVADEGA